MSYCLRRLAAPIAAMVAILALGMATPARADLEIWISATNNPPVVADKVAMGATSASFSGTIGGDAVVNLSAGSNAPGTASTAQLLGAVLSITNTNAIGGANVVLFITMSQTGFTTPVTPPNINFLSHIGGSVPFGDPANLLTYQSWVDKGNGQNTIGPGANFITTGAQTPGVTGGSFSSDAVPVVITSLAASYSVTQYYSITLSPQSVLNFASSTTLTNQSPVPEPSSLAIAGLGGLGLIGYGLRRRKGRGA